MLGADDPEDVAQEAFVRLHRRSRTMRFRHDKRLASEGRDLFQYLSDMGVTAFREPSYLLNGVFENLGHGHDRIINGD